MTETQELFDFIRRGVDALDGLREGLDAFENGDCREDFSGLANEWTQQVVSLLQMAQLKIVEHVQAARVELGETTIATAQDSD